MLCLILFFFNFISVACCIDYILRLISCYKDTPPNIRNKFRSTLKLALATRMEALYIGLKINGRAQARPGPGSPMDAQALARPAWPAAELGPENQTGAVL